MVVILTGGKSRRMGKDKAMLKVNGQEMSLYLAKRYAEQFDAVAFSVDRAGRFETGGFPELPDAFPGLGPGNGLYSAFTVGGADTVFLTATDMPCGDPALAKRLEDMLTGYDACVIRRNDGRVEPLFAWYRKSCLPFIEENLRSGFFSLRRLFSLVNTRYVDEKELAGWDLETVLRNLNTPEEYARFAESREKKTEAGL